MKNELDTVSDSFLEKHFIFTIGNEIEDICKPFFRQSQTTYFNYVRRYHDGSKICLSNCTEWMRHFYQNQLFKDIYIEKQTINGEKPAVNNVIIVLWAGLSDSRVVLEQHKHFNIGNGISLAFVHKDYIEYFYFAANSQNTAMSNWYINNIPTLINFTQYFKEKAKEIIEQAGKPQNLIVVGRYSNLTTLAGSVLLNNTKIESILPKHYCICHKNEDVYITLREMECIRHMVKGYSSSQTGKLLKISERTVEKHLENARQKLNCTTKSELIGVIFDNGLNNLLMN